MLNLQTSGIYHTDFPQYIRILTEDSFLESVAWRYMHWFYGQLDTVFVNSEEYRQSWIKRGFDPAKLKILPRGLDIELFTPARREPAFLGKIYCCQRPDPFALCRPHIPGERSRCFGRRLSPLAQRRSSACSFLLSVMARTRRSLRRSLPEAVFTGYLTGNELATAYASADIFVFPSTTDTFGNVILEAQACGVPVIVSDSGGPKELVEDRTNGLITRSHDVDDFTRADPFAGYGCRVAENAWAQPPEKASSIGAGQTRSANSGPRPTSRRQLNYCR